MRGKMLALLALLLLTGCPAATPPVPPAATVTLTWPGEADLDLEIWSDTGAYLTDANDWGARAEQAGCEEFAFRAYSAAEDLRGGRGADFGQGAYVVAVTVWTADTPCTATLTMKTADGKSQSITRELIAQNGLVWQVWRWDNGGCQLTGMDTVAFSTRISVP